MGLRSHASHGSQACTALQVGRLLLQAELNRAVQRRILIELDRHVVRPVDRRAAHRTCHAIRQPSLLAVTERTIGCATALRSDVPLACAASSTCRLR